MTAALFDQEASLKMELSRAGGVAIAAGLCVVMASTEALQEEQRHFLHGQELAAAERMQVKKRRGDFIRGRYACKRAITALCPSIEAASIHIGAGVFGQPILKPPNTLGLQLSLSHSERIGIALAVEEGHPMALDIEIISADRAGVIERALTTHEIALVAHTELPPTQALTMLWSMKEALSKVLKCGLTSPFHVLEVATLEHSGAQLTASFRHFTQYQAIAFALGQHACAIVLPRATQGLPVEALLAAFAAMPA